MLLKIVLCCFLSVVGTESADDACQTALDTFKDIQYKAPPYEDKKTGKLHCFFRLSKADEDNSRNVEKSGTWSWKKPEAVKFCEKYKAVLPRLKDPAIAEDFLKKTKDLEKEKRVILLGAKDVQPRTKPQDGTVTITWDDGEILQTNINKISGTDKKFVYLEQGKCIGLVDVDVEDGSWTCEERFPSKYTVAIFCQLTIAKPTGGLSTKPTGSSSTKPTGGSGGAATTKATLKVIFLVTTTLVFLQLLPVRNKE